MAEKGYLLTLINAYFGFETTAVLEYKFHPERKWRFDLAFPERKIAVEIEGGVWSKKGNSRHTTGAGYTGDMEKYNAATMLGWKLLRYTPQKIDFFQIFQLHESVEGKYD